MSRTAPSPDPSLRLAAAALGEAWGAAVLLDPELRVTMVSPQVRDVLGFDLPLGEPAPKVLCGNTPKRPLAEALLAGRAIHAVLPVPAANGQERRVAVRSIPLGPEGQRVGFVLWFTDAGGADKDGPVVFHGMWTQDAGMKRVFQIVERVAAEDVTVLVRGETGSGKELVAAALHALSPRHDGPFVALNCAALPEHLLESELFGHVKGAFTGAVRDTVGHVQRAHKGTLFLDEVAELPLSLQAKLLRAVETRTVLPVGAREAIPVDVRFVSATHRALRKEVEAGRFRADLMYRLRVIPIFIPPLRERPGDIRLLCEVLRREMEQKSRRKVDHISPAALAILESYDFPGNVRELKNVLAYAYAVGEGPVLLPSDLPPELTEEQREGQSGPAAVAEGTLSASGASPEATRILRALERTGQSRERAAQLLGMSRVTLWRRMRELGIAGRSH